MAKLTGKAPVLFAGSAVSSELAQFGSTIANEPSPPVFSTDPAVLQANGAWAQGWQDAIFSADRAPILEEMNGIDYVISYLLCYLYQEGITEWIAGVTYYLNSFVQVAGQIFISLQDNNTGNAPPSSSSNAFWKWVNPAKYLVGAAATVNRVPKVTNLSPSIGDAGSVVLSDSAISDDGTNVILTEPLKFPDGTIQTTASSSPFVSSPQAIPSAPAVAQFAHGLGVQPNSYSVSIRCVNSEFSYSVGDEVILGTFNAGNETTVGSNVTDVFVKYNAMFQVLNASGFGGATITAANWRLIFRASIA